jgi:hypothetical protein
MSPSQPFGARECAVTGEHAYEPPVDCSAPGPWHGTCSGCGLVILKGQGRSAQARYRYPRPVRTSPVNMRTLRTQQRVIQAAGVRQGSVVTIVFAVQRSEVWVRFDGDGKNTRCNPAELRIINEDQGADNG